ncbi:membrane protein [Zafaria cholistanensis]|uniref:Membrane protein n=1 Tax=Zafaria cholistanensis TaxID=1682741 RepID=A0A5A7NSR1_9MICC|nr:PepSY-associated TM helix domain-containing protein [Zafaria cholistanensis]GER23954.1 membrane protein [Zafaria cholistanensis]
MTSNTSARPETGRAATPPPATPAPATPAPAPATPASALAGPASGTAPWLVALLRRLHFYAGILVGPFLLAAAVTGGLYAAAPQIENLAYATELTGSPGTPLPLERQIQAAQDFRGSTAVPSAVRPGTDGGTTRVMFADNSLGESESLAVFVDPATAKVTGELTAYGTSGSLPLRAWIDQMHRSLNLGDAGRLYSELAASWLWVVTLGGVALWVAQRGRSPRPLTPRTGTPRTVTPRTGSRARLLGLHKALGLALAAGFVGLAATGLTWSKHAGDNVSQLRAALGWDTPSLSRELAVEAVPVPASPAHAGHQGHGGHAMADPASAVPNSGFDAALAAARGAGIDAAKVEIKPGAAGGQAWSVAEIDRSWPTQVDAVSLDPRDMAVVDSVDFKDFSVPAKLSRWGIDAHMGTLFGVANQVVLLALASGLACMVVWGYMMWWKRRPRAAIGLRFGPLPPRGALRRSPWWTVPAVAAAAVTAGVFVPLLGISLAGFLLVDLLRAAVSRRRETGCAG